MKHKLDTKEIFHKEVSPMEYMVDMTGEQAAQILESLRTVLCNARANGKSMLEFSYNIALTRAIEVLRRK